MSPPRPSRKRLLRSPSSLPMIAEPPVKAGGRGVGTSSEANSVADFIGAGWCMRMSSRLAGKGMHARCFSGFLTSGFGRAPRGHRARARLKPKIAAAEWGATRMRASTRHVSAPAPGATPRVRAPSGTPLNTDTNHQQGELT